MIENKEVKLFHLYKNRYTMIPCVMRFFIFQSNKHTDKTANRGWILFKAADNRLGIKLNTNKDGSDAEFEAFSYGRIST